MIANGVNLLLHSFLGGLRSYFGKLWASRDMDKTKKAFNLIEVIFHSLTVFLYTCTGILIVPFVRIYTQGVNDCDYIQPLFAFLLVISYAIQGIRVPYGILIHAAGRYKETQVCYIVSASFNLAISLILVFKWGLVGIAFGTAISLLLQVLWIVIYNSKHLLKLSLLAFGKICLMDLLAAFFSYVLVKGCIPESLFYPRNYYEWFILAMLVAIIVVLVIAIMVMFFYRKTAKTMLLIVKSKKIKHHGKDKEC